MLLGCIGDDFTGSSDLANMLVRGGMRVVQYSGTPAEPAAPEVEAGVVALKSRTVPADEAVRQSLQALEWLIGQGCEQFFFKYCSTFDSTREGNIGPVADAMIDRLGARPVIVCPAFPETGRSLYQGHLFVHDRLLSDSGMQHHPLTPMTDPDIRRWLGHQSRHGVGHVPYRTVARGHAAIRDALEAEDHALVVVDAVGNDDLYEIGKAARGLRLVTGGSGVALGLPGNFAGRLAGEAGDAWQGVRGPAAVLSGSCSSATLEQVERFARDHPALRVDPDALMAGRQTADTIFAWIAENLEQVPIVYASDRAEPVRLAQERHGAQTLATAIERLFAALARRLVAAGTTRLIAAGGETSGAVVAGLGIEALEVGPEIAPGVPALKIAGEEIAMALKSGNFGGPDFFQDALDALGTDA